MPFASCFCKGKMIKLILFWLRLLWTWSWDVTWSRVLNKATNFINLTQTVSVVQVPYLKGNEKQLHNEVSTKSLWSGNFEDSVALKRFLGASQLTSWYCKKRLQQHVCRSIKCYRLWIDSYSNSLFHLITPPCEGRRTDWIHLGYGRLIKDALEWIPLISLRGE